MAITESLLIGYIHAPESIRRGSNILGVRRRGPQCTHRRPWAFLFSIRSSVVNMSRGSEKVKHGQWGYRIARYYCDRTRIGDGRSGTATTDCFSSMILILKQHTGGHTFIVDVAGILLMCMVSMTNRCSKSFGMDIFKRIRLFRKTLLLPLLVLRGCRQEMSRFANAMRRRRWRIGRGYNTPRT
jgi:hypothetical protein